MVASAIPETVKARSTVEKEDKEEREKGAILTNAAENATKTGSEGRQQRAAMAYMYHQPSAVVHEAQ